MTGPDDYLVASYTLRTYWDMELLSEEAGVRIDLKTAHRWCVKSGALHIQMDKNGGWFSFYGSTVYSEDDDIHEIMRERFEPDLIELQEETVDGNYQRVEKNTVLANGEPFWQSRRLDQPITDYMQPRPGRLPLNEAV